MVWTKYLFLVRNNDNCMKNKLLVVWVLLFLFGSYAADAGFLVKKTSFISGSVVVKSEVSNIKTTTREKGTTFLMKVNEHLSFLHPYKLHKENEWFGLAAIGSGIIGLLVPGVNLLAILFGILGMGRGCKAQGLAVAGFVLGILELALFLILDTVFISLILL
jgi:hypothetical protein